MSDFFATLLSRSRGTTNVVRPRLASLFEPGAGGVVPADGASPAEAHPDAPVATAPAETVPIIATSAHGLALSPDPGVSHAGSHGRHGHDSRSQDDRGVGDADGGLGTPGRGGEGWDARDESLAFAGDTRLSARADGDGADGRRTRGGRGDHAARTAAAASAAAGGSAARGDVADGDVMSMPGAGAISASAMRAALAQVLSLRAGVSPRPDGSSGWQGHAAAPDVSLAAGTTPPAALLAAARPPASLAPMAVPSSSSRGATASHSRAEADARDPIIEISIGRIDVRAAVERSSDRKAAAPSPVMGLAEYLQTRAGARGGWR